jgi:hypothetical protein
MRNRGLDATVDEWAVAYVNAHVRADNDKRTLAVPFDGDSGKRVRGRHASLPPP